MQILGDSIFGIVKISGCSIGPRTIRRRWDGSMCGIPPCWHSKINPQ